MLSISLSSSFSFDLLDLKKFFSFHSCLGYGAGGVSFSSSTLDSGSGSEPSSGILDFLRKLNRKFNLFLAGFSASSTSSAVSCNSGEGFLDVVMGQIPEIRIPYPHFLLTYLGLKFRVQDPTLPRCEWSCRKRFCGDRIRCVFPNFDGISYFWLRFFGCHYF